MKSEKAEETSGAKAEEKTNIEGDSLKEQLIPVAQSNEPIVEEKVTESTKTQESLKDKLIKLNELKEEELISDEEYNMKKAEILKEM